MKKRYQPYALLSMLLVLTGCFSNEFEQSYRQICKGMEIPSSMCRCMVKRFNVEYGRDELNQAFIADRIDHVAFRKSFDRAGQQCLAKEMEKSFSE